MLKKYNKIWDKVSNSIKNGYNSGPVYSRIYQNTKIKSYKGKVNIDFHDNEIPTEGSHGTCLSVMIIDFVYKMGQNYYR